MTTLQRNQIQGLTAKVSLLALICLLSVEVKADFLPIRKHLTDATKINRARAPLYARQSNLKSLPLSYELITMENLAATITIKLDLKAKKYLSKGVGLFNDDLVDMALTPAYSQSFEHNNAPSSRINFDTSSVRKKWITFVNDQNLNQIFNEAVYLLESGELKDSNQNCLTRHFVESIARSVRNHEGHREKSEKLGLEDPKEILVSFLKMQINTLFWAQSLDRRAFDIQKQNIPLFCQDVPVIDYK